MTAQQVLRIDLREIATLEVTCTNCGAVFTVPLPKMNLAQRATCIGCNTQLWGGEEDQAWVRVLGVMRSLSNWKEFTGARFRLGFSLTQEHDQVPQ